MREMEELLIGRQSSETKNENFRKKYDSTIKATFSFIIVVTVFSCLLYVTRQPGDNYVTGLTIPLDYVRSLATKREFIPQISPPNCAVKNEQAQTAVMIMLWSSSSSTVDAADQMTVEKINEYINDFKSKQINQTDGLTGSPILTSFLVPPSYDASKIVDQNVIIYTNTNEIENWRSDLVLHSLNWATCNCSRNSTIIAHPYDQKVNYDSILEYSPFKGDDSRGHHHRRQRQRTGDRPSSSRSRNKIEKELVCLGKVASIQAESSSSDEMRTVGEYCDGSGFMMTSQVGRSIVREAEITKSYSDENLYVTGILRKKGVIELSGLDLQISNM